jgi:hypothetical protein
LREKTDRPVRGGGRGAVYSSFGDFPQHLGWAADDGPTRSPHDVSVRLAAARPVLPRSTVATVSTTVSPIGDDSRLRRISKVACWILGAAAVLVLLDQLGVDIGGWLAGMWDTLGSVPPAYLVAALVIQVLQTTLTATAWLFILRAAYREVHIPFAAVLTAYAVGVALNGILPASLGTFVMLYLFVAVIPTATFAGVLAGMVVQKLPFTLLGAIVYVYLFLSVPGSFSRGLSGRSSHPVVIAALVAVIVLAAVVGVRALWPKLRRQWEKAKQGGTILESRRAYLVRVVLPILAGYSAKLAGTAVFLAAFTIPVTFDSIMHVIGGNSIAGGTAVTPGGAGLNEAMSVVALAHYTDAQTAAAFAVGQHFFGTASSILVALILVPAVFGWKNGEALLKSASVQAKKRRAAAKSASQTA